jgi:hypothetical protein
LQQLICTDGWTHADFKETLKGNYSSLRLASGTFAFYRG